MLKGRIVESQLMDLNWSVKLCPHTSGKALSDLSERDVLCQENVRHLGDVKLLIWFRLQRFTQIAM